MLPIPVEHKVRDPHEGARAQREWRTKSRVNQHRCVKFMVPVQVPVPAAGVRIAISPWQSREGYEGKEVAFLPWLLLLVLWQLHNDCPFPWPFLHHLLGSTFTTYKDRILLQCSLQLLSAILKNRRHIPMSGKGLAKWEPDDSGFRTKYKLSWQLGIWLLVA